MILQSKSVGIDIQSNSVKIAVASLQGGKVKILDLIEKEIPDAPELDSMSAAAFAIREAFEENGLDGDTCAVSLPVAASINRVLTTPITDQAKIRQTLKFQLEPQIPYPIDQVITDFIPIRTTSNGTDILAVAITKDLIGEKLRLLKAAGVDPENLTLDAVALADFYMNPFDFSPDKITALLHINRSACFLGFFNGERLIGYRNLDGVPTDDADTVRQLVKEILRSLLGFQPTSDSDSGIGTLCVAGTHAEGFQKILQESFREFPVRVVEFNERHIAEIPPNAEQREDWQLAIALARTGLEKSANPLNFRREEFAAISPLSRLKPSIAFSLVLVVAAFIAWLVAVGAEIRHSSQELDMLNEQMVEIFADTMPGIKSPESAQETIRREQEKFKTLRNYSSHYVSPLDVLAAVNSSVPTDKTLTLSDLTVSDNILRMTGEAGSFDDINIFKQRLENSELLSEVNIDSATKADKSDKINFRIRARTGRESRGGF